VASVLGAVVTWALRIESTGVNLDQIGEPESKPEVATQPKPPEPKPKTKAAVA
jgi:hypothetical protein